LRGRLFHLRWQPPEFFIVPDKEFQDVLYDLLMRVEGQAVSFGGNLPCPHYTWLHTTLPDLPMCAELLRGVRPTCGGHIVIIV
jgi:hypothetical protein